MIGSPLDCSFDDTSCRRYGAMAGMQPSSTRKQMQDSDAFNSDEQTATVLMLPLEPRILLDAAGLLSALVDSPDSRENGSDTSSCDCLPFTTTTDNGTESTPSADTLATSLMGSMNGTREIIFVDAAVSDSETLLSSLPSGSELIMLNPQQSGVEQISRTLAQRDGLSAIHIVSHGDPGRLLLGTDTLDNASLSSHQESLASWAEALTTEADILLYGCDVAAGESGERLLSALADITGADVAASTDATGSQDQGGDWVLESETGAIETTLFASHQAQSLWSGLLSTSTTNVTITQEFAPGSTSDYDHFGADVDVDDSWAIVGSQWNDNGGTERGAAHIFSLSSSHSWGESATLSASDAENNDYFGTTVAIDDSYAIVGAYGEDGSGTDRGAAYIYYYNGSSWSQQAKLTASDAADSDMFGVTVDIYNTNSGDTYAVVGATGDDYSASNTTDRGAAYVFKRSGTSWSQEAKLTPDDASSATASYFGNSLAMANNTVLVGATGQGAGGNGQGQVYVFEYLNSSWSQQATITDTSLAAGSHFGQSLHMDDSGYAVTGSEMVNTNGTGAGAAYVLQRNSNASWSIAQTLSSSDISAGDAFGYKVRIDDGIIAVSADFDDHSSVTDAGAVYLFDISDSTWKQFAKVVADDAAASDNFGWGLGIDDNMLLVGSYNQDGEQTDDGSVYAFQIHDEVRLFDDATSTLTNPSSTYLTGGNYVQAWEFSGGIYSSIFSYDSSTQSFTSVNTGITATASGGSEPVVAALGNGGYVVTYTKSTDIYATIYDASGTVTVSEFVVNPTTSSTQDIADVTALSGGGFAVVWKSDHSGDYDIYGRTFNNSGSGGSEITLVNEAGIGLTNPVIAPTSSGGFVLAWENTNGGNHVYKNVYDSSGTALYTAGKAFSSHSDSYNAEIAVFSDDSFLIAVNSVNGASNMDIHAQLYASTSAVNGSSWIVNTTTANVETLPSVTLLSDNNALIGWQDTTNGILYGRLYNSSGTAQSGAYAISSLHFGSQSSLDLAPDKSAGFTASWAGLINSDKDIFANHFSVPTVSFNQSVFEYYYETDNSLIVGHLLNVEGGGSWFDDHSLSTTLTFSWDTSRTNDVLGIHSAGTFPDMIYSDGSKIYYSGEEIGSYTGGSGGSDLVITLTETDSMIGNALKKAIYFSNTDANPTLSDRTLTVTFKNDQGMSGSASMIVRFKTHSTTTNTNNQDSPQTNNDPFAPGPDGPGPDGPGPNDPAVDGPGDGPLGPDPNDPLGPGADGPGLDGPGPDDPGIDGPGPDDPGADEPGQDGPGQDGPGQDGPGQDGPGADGPPVLLDENGEPVLDAEGRPIPVDAEGNPLPNGQEGAEGGQSGGEAGDGGDGSGGEKVNPQGGAEGSGTQASGQTSLQQQLLGGDPNAVVTKSDIDAFTSSLMKVLSCGQ
ncbi:MAG: DUF4347 domain-containing protein [Magnetococcales bacterium]|nr:DUF4347 domain-containing protein [Magnetococcales bacterium]